MSKTYLEKVYSVKSTEEAKQIYDEWAGSYDKELLDQGYATPMRVARALAAQIQNMDKPVLDFGCGTGLSGAALIQNGFTVIDGTDLSAEMLAQAADKGVYRDLWQAHPGAELPFDSGKYHAITASGVIGSGAGPAELLDILMEGLSPRGLLAFSFNDHTLTDPDYMVTLRDWTTNGTASLLFEEHGPHIPGIDLGSTVYVFEKA
ncbi:class I SAM-dependent DNA methyltransferase [Psychromarinibacter sp. S121]|uniref:class I SAM-dependent DNA methyltransferase n=1 Tax=Psychromarinibacter sp. S121 TaxID=3415127 RepID=UPI003C7D9BAB